MLHHSLLLALLIATDAPADTAQHRYDATDPVQCLTIFSLTGNGGTQDGRGDLADEMTTLTAKLAEKHGGRKWLDEAQRPADEFARQLEKDMDGPAMMALLKACRAGLAGQ